MNLILLLRSTLFNIFLWLWTLIYGILFFPIALTIPKLAQKGIINNLWALVIIKVLRILCGIEYQVSGYQIKRDQNYIFASKHQSAWETIFFLLYMKDPIFIVKQELLYLPVYGWYLKKSGMIAINRQAGSAALLKMLKGVKNALSEGKSIIIFPEGTRVKHGVIKECNSGIAALYQIAEKVAANQITMTHKVCENQNQNIKNDTSITPVSIVPISLDSGKYWARNAWFKHSGIIKVRIGEPLPFGMKKEELLEKIKDEINKL